uniref:Sulfatase N-terminal domain-containing protein n=1 Tax=Ditylenchus dipsaci TaxID=166011 RepID=A0A915EM00_9BILA
MTICMALFFHVNNVTIKKATDFDEEFQNGFPSPNSDDIVQQRSDVSEDITLWPFSRINQFARRFYPSYVNNSEVENLQIFNHFLIAKVITGSKPNIILILADDLGFADVDWHDKNLHTPYLRDLAFSEHSTYLANSYVNQLCTPTRSALMTGLYPFRTGTQNGPQKLGYRNYMVGKWHLGYCQKEFLPTVRGGFDSFYGYYGPQQGYFNHSADLFDRNNGIMMRGLDLFREHDGVSVPDFSKNGIYSTHLFTEEAMQTISTHQQSYKPNPFFLYLAFQSVHSPLQAPAYYRNKCLALFHNPKRLTYCAILTAMDEAIGRVVEHLKRLKIYRNTIIIFSSDNGGDAMYGASNYPLRGQKNTLWEGGTKTNTFVHFPRLITKFSYRYDLFHVVDWYSTILSMAGLDVQSYGDGINQWPMIINNGKQVLRRNQFIYNVNTPLSAIRKYDFKLIYETKTPLLMNSQAGRARLFNLAKDPYESQDINRQHPALVRQLIDRLQQYHRIARKTARSPIDKRGNPAYLNGAFSSYWC